MATNKKMSVEEILAACRRMDGDGDSEAVPAPEPPAAADQGEVGAEEPAADESSAESESAPSPAAGKNPSEMNVADILAAARGGKTAAKPAAKKPAADKPAAVKKPAAKPAAAKAASKSEASVPKDTMSILAAARKASKPGPTSKAEARAKAEESVDSGKAKPKLVAPPMPEKPTYAVPPPAAPVVGEETRRGFFSSIMSTFMGSFLAVGFSSLGLTHVLWLLGLARFMFPNIRIEPPSAFRVGFPDDFAPGQVETKFKAQFGVWIVRDEYEGQSQIFALKSVCTHLGCTPNWLEGEQKFKCPCHGSGFYKDGINFEGPAPRPLERYAISLASDGQLVVEKSKIFNEEKGQWTDGASFVPV